MGASLCRTTTSVTIRWFLVTIWTVHKLCTLGIRPKFTVSLPTIVFVDDLGCPHIPDDMRIFVLVVANFQGKLGKLLAGKVIMIVDHSESPRLGDVRWQSMRTRLKKKFQVPWKLLRVA